MEYIGYGLNRRGRHQDKRERRYEVEGLLEELGGFLKMNRNTIVHNFYL